MGKAKYLSLIILKEIVLKSENQELTGKLPNTGNFFDDNACLSLKIGFFQGQLISKCLFGVIISTKILTEFF
jgi:hypothetical protein